MQVLLKFIARNHKDNVNLCKTCIGNWKNLYFLNTNLS